MGEERYTYILAFIIKIVKMSTLVGERKQSKEGREKLDFLVCFYDLLCNYEKRITLHNEIKFK